eukprot:CAMPEP_0183373622 /NCGR_PEP_ID=MMETSP0164_2-20130417/111957_1 /TAXON_ID=221442 /ORGANISM="Coccolithus pelagicus ssp braarudi, Strain PLY182g" /LENGTH=47 /DNA_ID= /DNA_START= /DNA_END= /DNA_ORIENTATION=
MSDERSPESMPMHWAWSPTSADRSSAWADRALASTDLSSRTCHLGLG